MGRRTTTLDAHDVQRARPTPTPGPRSRTAVVGYDGSEVARAAVSYAVDRVRPGGELIVTHVISPPPIFIEPPYYERALDAARSRAVEILERIDAPGLAEAPFTTELVEGPPAGSLVDLARQRAADEIIVGSGGYGRLRAALGSVSHALVHEADRPVAVVPRAAADRPGERSRPGKGRLVVVGYDGSTHASRALAYALETLGAGGRIVAVHAYHPPADFPGRAQGQLTPTDYEARGQELLDRLEHPPELVGRELAEGPPDEVLAQAAEAHDADEIVVGSRGLGRFRAALGSVSHALLNEAARPW